jgi:hypothetical protein
MRHNIAQIPLSIAISVPGGRSGAPLSGRGRQPAQDSREQVTNKLLLGMERR